MGFWGTFVVHRDERLLADLLPGVTAFGEAELCYDGVSGGWQVTRVFANVQDLPAGFLTELRDATGAPVLAAAVLDSDAAYVNALGLRTPGWRTWLHPDLAIDYQILAETPDGSAAAAAAIDWAREAGLRPGTIEEVTEVLDGREVFVEELFFALINRLGIATDEVETPVRPTIVDVLRGLFGHRLNAVDMAPHRPTRGERLTFPEMMDIRLHFNGQQAVTACGCGQNFSLLPSAPGDPADSSAQRIDGSLAQAFADLAQVSADFVGRSLTDAATVRHRYLPDLKGVVLRFGGRDLFIAAIAGTWTVSEGSAPPRQLMDALGPRWKDEIHLNPWLSSW